jgi:hypothetical protein
MMQPRLRDEASIVEDGMVKFVRQPLPVSDTPSPTGQLTPVPPNPQ